MILRDWVATGAVADQPEVEVVVSDEGRVIFGRCGCDAFARFALTRGPCAHLLALDRASASERRDLPTSVEAEPRPAPPKPRADEESLDESYEDGDD